MSKVQGASVPDSLAAADYLEAGGSKLRGFDFSGETVFSGVRVAPLSRPGVMPPMQFSPVSVVRVKDKVVDGHNGIFEDKFIDYLRSYLAFVSGKRLLIRNQELSE